MAHSHEPPSASPPPPPQSVAEWLWRDRVLLGAVTMCALIIGFQLVVTLLQPAWIGPVTDWLRAALAWPELLIVAYVSGWLSRARRPEALSWWMFSVGLLSYAIARTLWTVDDTLIYHHGVPFPILPDLFFVLQYPFFFLAVIFIPLVGPWGPRVIVFLDALLWIGTAAALLWYFLVASLFLASGLSLLAKVVSLGYPVADLFLLLALFLILLRPLHSNVDQRVVGILIAAVVCLIMADSGAIWLILHPAHVYRTGNWSDLLWVTSDLLVPLAALVQLRSAQRASGWDRYLGAQVRAPHGPTWDDLTAALRLFLPIVAALLASVAILLRAMTMWEADIGWRGLVVPLAVSLGLLVVLIVRQGITYLETVRLRREHAATRANEQALILLNRSKDEFLDVVSHEIRTPLASLWGYNHLLARRLRAWQPPADGTVVPTDFARDVAQMGAMVAHSEESLQRLTQLVGDLTDDAHIRDGRLTLHLARCDLRAIVRAAVEAQRTLEPERVIQLHLPAEDQPLLVEADAQRIGQVVTNYLTNALKYSKRDRPVDVHLGAAPGDAGGNAVAHVLVHDAGPGLSPAEQPRVWERFARIKGVAVQSGSGVSLGLGLHISRAIIEAHGGQVGVKSTLGQGSTFYFTLPLLASPPAAN